MDLSPQGVGSNFKSFLEEAFFVSIKVVSWRTQHSEILFQQILLQLCCSIYEMKEIMRISGIFMGFVFFNDFIQLTASYWRALYKDFC